MEARKLFTVPSTSTATHTVPTGLSAVPPSGPAMPVMPTPTAVPSRSRTPCAISRAVSSLTAPNAISVASRTPSCCTFTSS